MRGIFLELVGTQCSGKTRVAIELSRRHGFHYYPVEAEECWNVWDGRQYCFAVVMSSSWLRAVSKAVEGGNVVVDNSLLGVAGYSRFFGEKVVERHALEVWDSVKTILSRAMVKHVIVLLVADAETLIQRCKMRQREVSEWESRTAIDIQEKIKELLDHLSSSHGVRYHVVVNHGLEDTLKQVAELVQRSEK